MKTQYLSLEALSAVLSLPQNYLRQLAEQKQIPMLIVANRMRFQESEVRYALLKMARNRKTTRDLQQEHLAIETSKRIYNAVGKLSSKR